MLNVDIITSGRSAQGKAGDNLPRGCGEKVESDEESTGPENDPRTWTPAECLSTCWIDPIRPVYPIAKRGRALSIEDRTKEKAIRH